MAEPCKVFVGNLSYECSDDTLFDHFGQFGKIEEAIVIKDRETGRSRGFGFVTFASESDAQIAIKEGHGKDLMGRDVTVREAESKRGGGGGGRGGGGRYGGGGYGGGGYGGGGRRGDYDDQYRGGGGYGGGVYHGFDNFNITCCFCLISSLVWCVIVNKKL